MVVDSHTFFKALSSQRAPPTVTTKELEEHTKRARQKLMNTMSSMDRELADLNARCGAAERALYEARAKADDIEDQLSKVNNEKDKVSRVLYRKVQERAELEAEVLQEEQKVSHMRSRLVSVGLERERIAKSLASEGMALQEERLLALQSERSKLVEIEATIAREIVDLTDSINKGLELKARRIQQLKSVLAGD
jgi:predicted  nucleic acid-binding Zn-ribbon protein